MIYPKRSSAVPRPAPPQSAEPDTSGPPRLTAIHRSRGGRYEHLGDLIASPPALDRHDPSLRPVGTSLTQTLLLSEQASAAAGSSQPATHHTSDSPYFADLQQLAQLTEVSYTTHSFRFQEHNTRNSKARIRAQLTECLTQHGIPFAAIFQEHDGRFTTNINHIEHQEYFNSSFFPKNTLSAERKVIGERADSYLKHHQALKLPRLPPLPDLKGKKDLDILRGLLDEGPGVVVGEAHHCRASKHLLIKHMAELKRYGVTILFLEHLCADSHGQALQEYLQAPAQAPMPPRLEGYLKLQDKGNRTYGQRSPTGFVELVKAAKNAGLTIVPLDTAATYYASKEGGIHRIQLMNFYAAERIRLQRPAGKWIAFVGSGHATRYMGVPGLDELTGTRSLLVDDDSAEKKPVVSTNVKGYLDVLCPDVVLSYPRDIS